jgi:hypothetical protein
MTTFTVSVSEFFYGYMSADAISDIIAHHHGDLGAASNEIATAVREVLINEPEAIPANLEEVAYDACVAVFEGNNDSEPGQLTIEKWHSFFASIADDDSEEEFDSEGYDLNGFDLDGFDRSGFDCNGYDCQGYDWDGYSPKGYDRLGYDRSGFDCKGFDRLGYTKTQQIQSLFHEQAIISAELRVAHYAKLASSGDGWHVANLRRAELELAELTSGGYDYHCDREAMLDQCYGL